MASFIYKFIFVTAFLTISACVTVPSAVIFSDPSEFDGTWSGRMTLSIGEEKCVRRTPVTVYIKNGGLDGKLDYKKFDARLSGRVNKDGNIVDGMVEVPNDFYNYEIQGKFKGEKAQGIWKSKSCAGKWELRRIRKALF